MTQLKKINGGLYLVIDPALGLDFIVPKVEQAIRGGVDVLQIWNNWGKEQNKHELIKAVCDLAHKYHIPVLINEEWQLLQSTELDGAHFDDIPDIAAIRQIIERPIITGLTCGNNLNHIKWATDNQLDYISFCSMFPSSSAGICEIVRKETVMHARQLTSLPIFVAGGLSLNNIEELAGAGIDGIALISAIMQAEDAMESAKQFKEKLAILKTNIYETIICQ
jgi:thiamine-phosphate pyrophosphorylase